MQHSPQHSPDDSSSSSEQQSFDFLVSKHLIPPPLMLLPKPINNKPKSLLPMLPLPTFVGIIPNFQPLEKPATTVFQPDLLYNWIGEAFDNVIYQKYGEQSYTKIDNEDVNWNIWACDIAKMPNRKEQSREPILTPLYTPTSQNDHTLVFESRFQCGNLSLVSKVSTNEYNLLLQNDINTNSYSQWFFFKVSNTHKDQRVTFKILNNYKKSNLYRMGMRIVVYSQKESQMRHVSWHRGGENILYYQNSYSRSQMQCGYLPYYTLQWEYNFAYAGDQVYFAYNYPYTYSNLCNFIFKIESDPLLRQYCQRCSLCKTLAGNRVDILTITEDIPGQYVQKGYIIITARIHPGETVSSFVCNGIIQFLLSNSPQAKKLRENFVFKIVPMLNPDGVIHGNYRSNLSGYDLNKKWQNPSQIYHTEMFHLKKLIASIKESSEILLFCDLHGHASKKNAFIYGCHDRKDPLKGKSFPLLVSKLFKGFSFKDCSFLDVTQVEHSARTFLSKQLNHCDIYSLESSFCGPEYEDIHFTVRHFEELGQKFCQAILIYFQANIKNAESPPRERSYLSARSTSSPSLFEYNVSHLNDTNNSFEFMDSQVNSENSQGSHEESQSFKVLEEKTVKKYMMRKFMQPYSVTNKRSNIFVRRGKSKEIYQKGKVKEQATPLESVQESPEQTKIYSALKKKEVFETPSKVYQRETKEDNKHKTTLRFVQKKELPFRMFEPIDIAPQLEHRRQHRSVTKLTNNNAIKRQKVQDCLEGMLQAKHGVKIVLAKNYEFDQEEYEPVFKNNYLRGLGRQELFTEKPFLQGGERTEKSAQLQDRKRYRPQSRLYKKGSKTARKTNVRENQQQMIRKRKNSQFIIRKKTSLVEDKNSNGISLFNSVLSSLLKGKK